MAFWRSKGETNPEQCKDSARSTPPINLQTAPIYKDTEFGSSPVAAGGQIKHLNNYISELMKENERLQNITDDLKTSNSLNKQMINDYVNIINEQNDEIQALRGDKDKL